MHLLESQEITAKSVDRWPFISSENEMNYRIDSRDYLARARRLIDGGSLESLFYAAFELRCGIEARLQQYLEAQSHISEKRKKGWRIAELAKNIEKVFQTGDKVVEFAVYDQENDALLYTFYYTPVRARLRKMGEQLGNYLHSMRIYHHPQDKWWVEMRNLLEKVYGELRKANLGTMLGVPLLDPKTNRIVFSSELAEGEQPEDLLKKVGEIGTVRKLRVRYLNEVPGELSGGN